jgi:hypothetical protein
MISAPTRCAAPTPARNSWVRRKREKNKNKVEKNVINDLRRFARERKGKRKALARAHAFKQRPIHCIVLLNAQLPSLHMQVDFIQHASYCTKHSASSTQLGIQIPMHEQHLQNQKRSKCKINQLYTSDPGQHITHPTRSRAHRGP